MKVNSNIEHPLYFTVIYGLHEMSRITHCTHTHISMETIDHITFYPRIHIAYTLCTFSFSFVFISLFTITTEFRYERRECVHEQGHSICCGVRRGDRKRKRETTNDMTKTDDKCVYTIIANKIRYILSTKSSYLTICT